MITIPMVLLQDVLLHAAIRYTSLKNLFSVTINRHFFVDVYPRISTFLDSPGKNLPEKIKNDQKMSKIGQIDRTGDLPQG